MELTLTITPDTAAAILEAMQPAALRFLEAVAKAAKEAWEWLKRGATKAAKIAARLCAGGLAVPWKICRKVCRALHRFRGKCRRVLQRVAARYWRRIRRPSC